MSTEVLWLSVLVDLRGESGAIVGKRRVKATLAHATVLLVSMRQRPA